MIFVRLVAYIWVNYKVLVLAAFIAAKAVTALYLHTTGYDRWYTGLIPFGWLCYGRDAGISMPVLLIRIVCEIMFITSYQLVFFIPSVASYIVVNYLLAEVYVDTCDPRIFAGVPFYKYYIMIKEVLRIAGNESG